MVGEEDGDPELSSDEDVSKYTVRSFVCINMPTTDTVIVLAREDLRQEVARYHLERIHDK